MSQTAESAAGFALAAYTAPVRAELRRWRRQGLSLRQMAARMPTLRFNTRALASLLHHTYATALLPPADAREAEADAVLLTLDALDSLLQSRAGDHTTAANPYGCNQHRHKQGCPHAGGGVDTDLEKNLEAALRRARREDGTVEQGGELSRTHEVRLREMPEVLKALGEPDVPLVMTVHHIRKIAGRHGLTVEQMQEVAAKLNDPLLVMQADVQKYLILLDMDAYEKHDKAMRPVICFVERKPGKTHAEHVVSSYPLQKEKYRKVIGQVKSLLYSKFRDEKTAQFAADAPQCSEARDLLRAAIKSGFADSVLTWEDIVKPKKGQQVRAAAADDYRDYVPELEADAMARTAAEWAELEPEARVGKFFTARVEDERLLLALQDLVARCLSEGVSEAEFVHRALRLLENLPRPDGKGNYYDPAERMRMPPNQRLAYDNDVRHLDSRARLKLIYRTQSEMAAGYRQWRKNLARLERYPAWRFVRQPGARIKRPDHVAHEEDVRLITDIPYWLARNSPDQGGFGVPYPPFGYNSWMRVEQVSRKEAEKLGLLKKGEKITIPPEMARYDMRAAVEQSNTASMDGLPEAARQRVTDDCHEAGIELHPAEGGSTRAQPTAPAPIADDDPDLMLDILELLDEIDSILADFDNLHASNPQGCNQHRHKQGCKKYTGHTNQNTLQHEQQHEQHDTRPAAQPTRPRDLLRRDGAEDGADEKSGYPRAESGDLLQPLRPGGDGDSAGSEDARERAGQRIRMPEAYSRLEAQSWDSIPSSDLAPILTFQAEVTAAQLSAVYAGRKPAFIEPDLRMVRPFAEHLPPGIHYVRGGSVEGVLVADPTNRALRETPPSAI